MVLLAFIIVDYYLPITSSLMNPLIQTSNYSPKNYGRNINVGFMVIPRKRVTPLWLFLDLRHNNNPKAPHNEKQKNIKPSLDS